MCSLKSLENDEFMVSMVIFHGIGNLMHKFMVDLIILFCSIVHITAVKAMAISYN